MREAGSTTAFCRRFAFPFRPPPFGLLVVVKLFVPLLLTDGDVLATESAIECDSVQHQQRVEYSVSAPNVPGVGYRDDVVGQTDCCCCIWSDMGVFGSSILERTPLPRQGSCPGILCRFLPLPGALLIVATLLLSESDALTMLALSSVMLPMLPPRLSSSSPDLASFGSTPSSDMPVRRIAPSERVILCPG